MAFDAPHNQESTTSRAPNQAELLMQRAVETREQQATNQALTHELKSFNQASPDACTEAFYKVYLKQTDPSQKALSLTLAKDLGIAYEPDKLPDYEKIVHLVIPDREGTIRG